MPVNYRRGKKVCKELNCVRIEAENLRSRLSKKFYDSGDIYFENVKYYYLRDINLASKFDANFIYQTVLSEVNLNLLKLEIKFASEISLNLIKIHIAAKQAITFLSNEIEQDNNIDNFNFTFFKEQFVDNMKKYIADMEKQINETKIYKDKESQNNYQIKEELIKHMNSQDIGKIEEIVKKHYFFFTKTIKVYRFDKNALSKILGKSSIPNIGEYSENINFCNFFLKQFEVLMIKNFPETYKSYKEVILKNQKEIDKNIITIEEIFNEKKNLQKPSKIKYLTELQKLIDISKSIFKDVLEIEI